MASTRPKKPTPATQLLPLGMLIELPNVYEFARYIEALEE